MNYIIYNSIASMLNFLSEIHTELFESETSANNSDSERKKSVPISRYRYTYTHICQREKKKRMCTNAAKY